MPLKNSICSIPLLPKIIKEAATAILTLGYVYRIQATCSVHLSIQIGLMLSQGLPHNLLTSGANPWHEQDGYHSPQYWCKTNLA